MKPVGTAFLLLALFGPPAGAVADNLDSVLSRSPYAPADKTLVASLVRTAVSDGIPAEVFTDRIEEALAKGIGADRLVPALVRERELYHQGRQVLETEAWTPEPAVWQRAVLLLRAGVSVAQLGDLVRAWTGRKTDFVAATTTLFVLHDWGLSWDEAVDLGRALGASALPTPGFPFLLTLLSDARQQLKPTSDVLGRIDRALLRARSIPELRREVLQP